MNTTEERTRAALTGLAECVKHPENWWDYVTPETRFSQFLTLLNVAEFFHQLDYGVLATFIVTHGMQAPVVKDPFTVLRAWLSSKELKLQNVQNVLSFALICAGGNEDKKS